MKIQILSIFVILLLLTGCNGTFEVGLEPLSASANNTQPTATTAPAPTDIPIQVVTIVPQETPVVVVPVEVGSPTDTPELQLVQIYLIAIDDNGQSGNPVGCGDSSVPVQVQIQPTQGVLNAALEALLSIKDQYYGQSGLYNALYQSDLQVESVKITDGAAEVYLTGTLMLGGECDNPRVQAQLEQTVLQFPSVTSANIYINGKTLADALSLKGT